MSKYWNGDIYSSDLDFADMIFGEKNYGEARCHYYMCLKNTEKFQPDNKQRIDYIKQRIKECDKYQSE